MAGGCASQGPIFPPQRFLLVTHPALNRLTIYDLDSHKLVGALPTQKLPHDMLVSRDRMLYVVNSGSQCITTYDLKSPEFWDYARSFMNRDSANLYAPRTPSANMMGRGQSQSPAQRDTTAWTTLHRDQIQLLPASFARTYLTDTVFPAAARVPHEKVNAFAHNTCYDCHDRSIGGRPFGPAFSQDSTTIRLVHLRGHDITILDARTLHVERKIPLPIPADYSPIETWISSDHNICFVTCRNEIGQSKPGIILVVSLRSGNLLKTIQGGIYPWHLLPDSSGERLYINNFQSSRISILDVARREIVDSLIVQNGPAMMSFWPGRNVLVVSCFYTDRVLFVDLATKQVVKSIDVDSNPTSLEFTKDGNELLVLCGGESSLDVVDVQRGGVKEKHRMLFGAYAFHEVTTD